MQFPKENLFQISSATPTQAAAALATYLLRTHASAAGQFAQVADINANKICVNYLIKSYIRSAASPPLCSLLPPSCLF